MNKPFDNDNDLEKMLQDAGEAARREAQPRAEHIFQRTLQERTDALRIVSVPATECSSRDKPEQDKDSLLNLALRSAPTSAQQLNRTKRFSQHYFKLRPWWMLASTAAVIAVCLIGMFVAHSRSEAAIWYAGRSRAQLRAVLPDFPAMLAAPEILPTGTEAVLGPDEIPTPNLREDGFEVRSDSKLYDMTWWRPIDQQDRDSRRLSPVVFTRVITLRRIPNHPTNSKLHVKFWTTGFCVDPVKVKSSDEVIAARKPEGLAKDGPPTKTFLLTTDVSDRREGEWFQMTIHAIYWNGFNTPVKEWAGSAAASSDVTEADLGVLLPPNRSIRVWSLYNVPPKQTRAPENRIRAGHPPREESGLIYWPIPAVEQGHKYVIEWEWDEEH